MEGGRSTGSLPQSVTVVPRGEHPMSRKSFDVSFVHENEMEGGRSTESLPQSVTVVPRGERPMSRKSFDVSLVHENEMEGGRSTGSLPQSVTVVLVVTSHERKCLMSPLCTRTRWREAAARSRCPRVSLWFLVVNIHEQEVV
ncbi:hypothetical protein TcBrA4_0101770 [Trypanosoma cruzi]|nr:hypothetical protein TcBrA4_0101770 [Trypanosoma cruzi]